MCYLQGVVESGVRLMRTFGLLVPLMAASWGSLSAEESAWYTASAKRAREAIDDTVAARILVITHPTGKNPRLGEVSTRPDGDGLLALITVHWNGGFLNTPYATVVQWRFSPTGHLNSGIVSDGGVVRVTEAAKTELDSYLRLTVWPKVKVDGGEGAGDNPDLGTLCRSLEADVTRFLAKPIAQATRKEGGRLLGVCAAVEGLIEKRVRESEQSADKSEARAKDLEESAKRATSQEEKAKREEGAIDFSRRAKLARADAEMWRKRSQVVAGFRTAVKERMEALE